MSEFGGDGFQMVFKAVIFLLIFFTSSGLSFAYDEWPEGWSREEAVATFGRYSTDYSIALTGEGDRLVAGFLGNSINDIQLVLLENGKEVFRSGVFFNASQPELIVDSRENRHLFWVERQRTVERLLYTSFDSNNNLKVDSLVLRESTSRISGVNAREEKDGLIHLIWSDVERPAGVLLHAVVREGEIVQKAQVLKEDEQRLSNSTFVFDEEGQINLFWRKVNGWEMNCYYQRFSPEGEAIDEPQNLAIISALDGDRSPFVDGELEAFLDTGGRINLVFSGQDREIGMQVGHFSLLVIEDGKLIKGPSRISPSFNRLRTIDVLMKGEFYHLAWVHLQGGRYRPFYLQVSGEGEVGYGPQPMDITTSGGFNPTLLEVGEYLNFFWQRSEGDVGQMKIFSRNNANPQTAPLGYQLGLGLRNPHLGLLYVLGVGLVYAALLTLVTKFLAPVATFIILAAGSRLKLIGNLEKFPVHGTLVLAAGLFLFQDTVLDFIQLEWPGRYFPLLAAGLSTSFTLLMKIGEKRWLNLDNTMGWVFCMVLWVYWYTFFTLIPHLIITS